MLEEAKKLGIYRLMPTCGQDNVASRRVIEANGGEVLPLQNPGDPDENELRFLILLEPETSQPG